MFYKAFADRCRYLIMSLSRSKNSHMLHIHYSTMNNIMCVVKALCKSTQRIYLVICLMAGFRHHLPTTPFCSFSRHH